MVSAALACRWADRPCQAKADSDHMSAGEHCVRRTDMSLPLTLTPMVRIAASLFLIAHGFAHLVGFATSWKLSDTLPYHTTVFGGRVEVGPGLTRTLGGVWLLVATAFFVSAAGLLRDAEWWRPFTVGVVVLSLVMCLLEWPLARIGLVIDAALLLVLTVVKV